MKRKKILIVSTAYLPLIGGAELAIKETTDRLYGYEFDLICARIKPTLKRRERVGNVNVYRIGFGLNIDKYILPFFVFFRSARDYHLVWTVMASYGSFGVVWRKVLGLRARNLLTLQEGDSEEHILRRLGIFYPFWKSVFRGADRIQAISSFLADFARRHGARCPIEIIPNGMDAERFGKISDKRQKTNDNIVIITTSRLVHKNGIDTLIKAAAQLESQLANTKYQVQIIGSGEDENKLKNLAHKLGVDELVEFIGHVDPKKIPEYLARADIFVRVSRSEGLGSSFIEAMAAGLPIIGTSVGGIPDFLKDGETGLFVDPDDPEDLTEKIKTLLNNSSLREKLSRQGRKLALRNYSWDSIAEKMDIIFQKT